MKIEAVIFDWGGVLIDNPVEDMIVYSARVMEVDPRILHPSFLSHKRLLQDGRISEETFWDRIADELGVIKPSRPSLMDEAFRASYREREDVFELAAGLHRRGYKTALLSNTEAPSVAFFTKSDTPCSMRRSSRAWRASANLIRKSTGR